MSDEHAEIVNEYGQFAQLPIALLSADTKVVSNTAKVLYAWLWQYSDGVVDRSAFPSRKTLAENLGVSVDTVDRAIKQLVAFGILNPGEGA